MKQNYPLSLDLEKIRTLIETFIGSEKDFILENKKDFLLIYGSYLYGNLGMQLRNFIRREIPEIDDEFQKCFGDDWYQKYEDLIFEITKQVCDIE